MFSLASLDNCYRSDKPLKLFSIWPDTTHKSSSFTNLFFLCGLDLSAPPDFTVKTPVNFCWWLLTHLSPLYWFTDKGVYSQRKKVTRLVGGVGVWRVSVAYSVGLKSWRREGNLTEIYFPIICRLERDTWKRGWRATAWRLTSYTTVSTVLNRQLRHACINAMTPR